MPVRVVRRIPESAKPAIQFAVHKIFDQTAFILSPLSQASGGARLAFAK